MECIDVGVADKRHVVACVLRALTVARDLDEEPPRPLEVLTQEVVEGQHVLLFAEFDVVCYVLQGLGHEH